MDRNIVLNIVFFSRLSEDVENSDIGKPESQCNLEVSKKNDKSSIHRRKVVPVNTESPLKCIICGYLLDNPHQSACGCRGCYECWLKYLENERTKLCPGGSEDCESVSFLDKSLRPDPAAKKDCQEVPIHCVNREGYKGCQEQVKMKDLEEHLRNDCQFNKVLCDKCNESIPQQDLKSHKNECEMEFEKCRFCHLPFIRRDMRMHHNNLTSDKCCQSYRGPCPYCNYTPLTIHKIDQHKKNCPNWRYKCEFESVGCSFEGTQTELANHMETQMQNHLKLAGDTVSGNQSILNNYQDTVEKVRQNVKSLDNKIERCFQLTNTAMSLVQNFRSDPAPYPQHHHIPSVIHKNGSFVWKITDFSSKRSTAMSGTPHITSEPFYSSPFGYKLCARIYLNGDGQATGNYISLFIVLMKGEYDDILSWPFANKVTVSLLDQEGRNNDHSHTFRPDPNSECFQQPRSELNTASGVPSFYSLTSLTNSNSRYLKNDTIYVKIRIHPSNS